MRSGSREVERTLRIAGLTLIGAVIILVLVAFLLPYDVELKATYSDPSGEVWVEDQLESEAPAADELSYRLAPGETLSTEGNSRVRIEILPDSRAFAYLSGDAQWKLITAQRRATFIQHILGMGGTYQIVIEQSQGTIVYDFSQSDPDLDDLNLEIRFPDGTFTPQSACFQATAPQESAPSAVVEVPCANAITPQTEPTLPPLN